MCLQIWTSARRRSHHTAWPFLQHSTGDGAAAPRVKVIEKPQMSEINPGVWDGLTPEQVVKYFPDEWERFVRDPYAYRAPRAESYHDLCGTSTTLAIPLHPLTRPPVLPVVRLEPTLIELERERELIVLDGDGFIAVCMARGRLLDFAPARRQ